MKKDYLKLLVFACISTCLFVFFTQCDNDYVDPENVNCNDCYTEKPELSALIINFSETISDSVLITVFRGYVNESMLEWEGYVKSSPFFLYETPVDNYYSVKATYLKNGTSIQVVDADELKTQFVENVCDSDCFIVTGGEYNVKYDKIN